MNSNSKNTRDKTVVKPFEKKLKSSVIKKTPISFVQNFKDRFKNLGFWGSLKAVGYLIALVVLLTVVLYFIGLFAGLMVSGAWHGFSLGWNFISFLADLSSIFP